jgi:hypothetical protein
MCDGAGELVKLTSVRPLRALCLGGDSLLTIAHHRDTENAEVAQRKLG